MRSTCEVNKVVKLKKGFYVTKLGYAALLDITYCTMCYYIERGLPIKEFNMKTTLIEIFEAWEWLKKRNYLTDRTTEIESRLSSFAKALKYAKSRKEGIVLSKFVKHRKKVHEPPKIIRKFKYHKR
jgi:hypothetical protein